MTGCSVCFSVSGPAAWNLLLTVVWDLPSSLFLFFVFILKPNCLVGPMVVILHQHIHDSSAIRMMIVNSHTAVRTEPDDGLYMICVLFWITALWTWIHRVVSLKSTLPAMLTAKHQSLLLSMLFTTGSMCYHVYTQAKQTTGVYVCYLTQHFSGVLYIGWCELLWLCAILTVQFSCFLMCHTNFGHVCILLITWTPLQIESCFAYAS